MLVGVSVGVVTTVLFHIIVRKTALASVYLEKEIKVSTVFPANVYRSKKS